jgi:hypothetical protein
MLHRPVTPNDVDKMHQKKSFPPLARLRPRSLQQPFWRLQLRVVWRDVPSVRAAFFEAGVFNCNPPPLLPDPGWFSFPSVTVPT